MTKSGNIRNLFVKALPLGSEFDGMLGHLFHFMARFLAMAELK